jgi:nucleotide-binding universal stress UspA family protein
MFKTIILGLDGSPESRRALPFAVQFADRDAAKIIAVHVRELVMGRAGGQTLVANEDEVVAAVRGQVDEIAATGVEIELKVVSAVAGGPAHVLAEVAGKEQADVIVVGTRGHGQVAGLLIGSVTQRLLHVSPCPVFAVPPTIAASTDQVPAELATVTV